MCCAAALPLLHLDMVPEGPRRGQAWTSFARVIG